MSIAKFIAGQLRQPAGFFGRQIMVRVLNRMNYSMNTLALEVLQLSFDDHVLEVGFGGGELMARMASIVYVRQDRRCRLFERCCRYMCKTF